MNSSKYLVLILVAISLVFIYRRNQEKQSILVYGNESARIAIVNYTSFQCPPCKIFHEKFGDLLQKYISSGDVKLIIKPVDLTKFKYDDIIYTHLTDEFVKDYNQLKSIYESQLIWRDFEEKNEVISYLNLDENVNPQLLKDLRKNTKEKNRLKLQGVPTTFLNNEQLPIDITVEEFESRIEELIK